MSILFYAASSKTELFGLEFNDIYTLPEIFVRIL